MRRILIAAAVLVVLVAPGFVVKANVESGHTILGEDALRETFEGYDSVSRPEPEGPYTFGTHMPHGGSSYVTKNAAQEGTKSLYTKGGGGSGQFTAAGLQNTAMDLCVEGQAISFWVMAPTMSWLHLNVMASVSAGKEPEKDRDGVGIRLKTDGSVEIASGPSGSSTSNWADMGFTYTNQTWYHFRISDMNCTSFTHPAVVCEMTQEICSTTASRGVTSDITDKLDSLVVDILGGGQVYLDNVTWTAIPVTEIGAVQSWCPDPVANHFGYNYRKNVEFSPNMGGHWDLNDAFVFAGDDTDEAYAFKVWNHETRDVSFHATLEAGVDGQRSKFLAYFFGQDPTPWLDGDSLLSSSTGNGEYTGLLADSILVKFEESGSEWHISVMDTYGGDLIQKGQAWKGGSANKPSSWIVQAKTGIGEGDFGIKVFGPGNVKVLDIFPTEQDRIWGVGLVAESRTSFKSFTALNNDEDNSNTHNSSCYFFNDIPEGDGDFVGSTGAIANNQNNTLPDEPVEQEPGGSGAFGTGGAGDAVGLSDEAMGWFFGIIFTVMVTFGLAQIHPVLIVPGVAVGIGGAVAFSYLPLWLPVFIVLLAAAVIVLRMKGGGG